MRPRLRIDHATGVLRRRFAGQAHPVPTWLCATPDCVGRGATPRLAYRAWLHEVLWKEDQASGRLSSLVASVR